MSSALCVFSAQCLGDDRAKPGAVAQTLSMLAALDHRRTIF